mmetsp:Transcript_11337/g.39006  ORF Transcript_11337/g.39006 Transcript_11337/m.39006 type:complete len:262 (+) Transcript_11337:1-786(+)
MSLPRPSRCRAPPGSPSNAPRPSGRGRQRTRRVSTAARRRVVDDSGARAQRARHHAPPGPAGPRRRGFDARRGAVVPAAHGAVHVRDGAARGRRRGLPLRLRDGRRRDERILRPAPARPHAAVVLPLLQGRPGPALPLLARRRHVRAARVRRRELRGRRGARAVARGGAEPVRVARQRRRRRLTGLPLRGRRRGPRRGRGPVLRGDRRLVRERRRRGLDRPARRRKWHDLRRSQGEPGGPHGLRRRAGAAHLARHLRGELL